MTSVLAIVLALLAFMPNAALAWWNADWTNRRSIMIDASPAGADLKEGLSGFVVPVRLHTGNFPFLEAKEDGSDLRIIAADDQTPLKFHIEKFDSINELAILWVQVPSIPSGAKAQPLWLYWGNEKSQPPEAGASTYDASHLAVLHFSETDGKPRDTTAYGHHASAVTGAQSAPNGPLGAALALDGSGAVVLGPAPGLRFGAAGFTLSGWIKPAVAQKATLFSVGDAKKGMSVSLDGTAVDVRLSDEAPAVQARGGELATGRWTHLAVTVSERLVIYVDGREVANVAARPLELTGEMLLGNSPSGAAGYAGEFDAVQIAGVARSPGWVRAAWAAQSPDGKLVTWGEQEVTGGGASYLGILVSALTLDAWIVIGILGVMFVLSIFVMVEKALFVARAIRGNAGFREAFAGLQEDFSALRAAPNQPAASPLHRLYELGVGELEKRLSASSAQGKALRLTPQAMDSIRASLDAGMSRESRRLNDRMVLLTIAISGGPFLGLLGTVVGVMIVFAAVAAAGDVNVNAIAPGIAAALLATVAGLGVAIPALFGYNYLASRIKEVTADMRVFADELLTRLAERHPD